MSDPKPLVPEVKSIGGWDIADLSKWTPEDPNAVAFEATVEIGTPDDDASDSFFVRIATPDGLKGLDAKDGLLATGPLLVFERYDYETIARTISNFASQCVGSNWPECAERLQRYFRWEYEDYKIAPDPNSNLN